MVWFGECCINCSLTPSFTPIQTGVSCKWTGDSQRLILESFDVIRDSPSHIYHSAIPFSPSSSWLRQSYAVELSQEVRVVTGLPAKWGTCTRTIALDDRPRSLACWKDTIAVGLDSGSITLLNAITGSQTATLSGNPYLVQSIAFSLDGMLLVSGHHSTVIMWDVQTGGVVKTFYGPTDFMRSVSISLDCSTVASGSLDQKIYLWNTQTGECCSIIQQHIFVNCVNFSPTDPRRLISASGQYIQQWDIDGHQIGPGYDGTYHCLSVSFSPDGTQFVSCDGPVVIVQNSESGEIMGRLHGKGGFEGVYEHCCFSPDGKYVAAAIHCTIHTWDATSLEPHCIGTFFGHTSYIISLAFSSSLISVSDDHSVKFWQTRPPAKELVTANQMSTPLDSPPANCVTLRAEDGIAISTHLDRVVKIWDISTGLCRASFQTPAKGTTQGDTQLINNILVSAWWADQKIYICDVEKGELLQTIDALAIRVECVRVSEDGSKVFFLDNEDIRAWSISTGEHAGWVDLRFLSRADHLTIDGSRVWAHRSGSYSEGWDFGIPGSRPVRLSNIPLSRPHLVSMDSTKRQNLRIRDPVTGKELLWLHGRFEAPADAWWDGRYLVAGYKSGEVLILDFVHVLLCTDL